MGTSQEKAETPMEIALDRNNREVFKMLEEVAKIPDKIKLIQLKKIIQSEIALFDTALFKKMNILFE